jgi:hypothetical protein
MPDQCAIVAGINALKARHLSMSLAAAPAQSAAPALSTQEEGNSSPDQNHESIHSVCSARLVSKRLL